MIQIECVSWWKNNRITYSSALNRKKKSRFPRAGIIYDIFLWSSAIYIVFKASRVGNPAVLVRFNTREQREAVDYYYFFVVWSISIDNLYGSYKLRFEQVVICDAQFVHNFRVHLQRKYDAPPPENPSVVNRNDHFFFFFFLCTAYYKTYNIILKFFNPPENTKKKKMLTIRIK